MSDYVGPRSARVIEREEFAAMFQPPEPVSPQERAALVRLI